MTGFPLDEPPLDKQAGHASGDAARRPAVSLGKPGEEGAAGPVPAPAKAEPGPVQARPGSARPEVDAPPDVDVRASDADRDQVADILREALAQGRLDAEEHSERVEAAYSAKTMGQLEPLVRDLPRPTPPSAYAPPRDEGPWPPHGASDHLVAIFNDTSRKGRWRIGPKTNVFACFGSVRIDLTEAIFEQRRIVINATSLFGGISVKVPENVTLRGKGAGIFGGFDISPHDSPDPDAPVVLVQGAGIFGAVEARPKRGKFLRDLRKER